MIQLIRTHLSKLEGFGRVGFEIQPFQTLGGAQSREIAVLNERQATLVLTFMRNSPVVVDFKVRLVDALYRLAEAAQAKVQTFKAQRPLGGARARRRF